MSEEQSSVPQSSVPQSSVPQSSVPQSSVPQSPTPQSPVPQSPAPQSSVPQSSVPQSSVPQSPVPQSPVPQSSVPQSSVPQSSVPRASSAARNSIASSVASVTVFLFALMLLTGMLLSAYYVPSTSPSFTDDGRELGAATVVDSLVWLGARYEPGETIALPMNIDADAIDIPPGLVSHVVPRIDSVTGRVVRPSAAWTSTEVTISKGAALGSIIRSIHHYAASLFIASLILQIAITVVRYVDRRPSASTWLIRIAILALALVAAYTGSILPWHRLSFTALHVGSASLVESIPILGSGIARMVFGNPDAAQIGLSRAHALHVAVLPIVTALLLGSLLRRSSRNESVVAVVPDHSYTIALLVSAGLLGIAIVACGSLAPDSPYAAFGLVLLPVALAAFLAKLVAPSHDQLAVTANDAADRPYRTRYREILAWLFVFGAVATVALTASWRPPGDAGLPVDVHTSTATPVGARPEWYLMFAYGALSLLPGPVAAAVIASFVALLVAVPRIARTDPTGRRTQIAGFVALAALVALTIIGYMRA